MAALSILAGKSPMPALAGKTGIGALGAMQAAGANPATDIKGKARAQATSIKIDASTITDPEALIVLRSEEMIGAADSAAPER